MIVLRPSRLKVATAAFAILLLMLSSQVAGETSSEMQARQQTPPPPPPAGQPTAPPQQSSPGQLSYTNTWNRTQPSICLPSSSSAAKQDPLVVKTGQSWSLTTSIPLVLAESGPSADAVTTITYTAFSNGTVRRLG